MQGKKRGNSEEENKILLVSICVMIDCVLLDGMILRCYGLHYKFLT